MCIPGHSHLPTALTRKSVPHTAQINLHPPANPSLKRVKCDTKTSWQRLGTQVLAIATACHEPSSASLSHSRLWSGVRGKGRVGTINRQATRPTLLRPLRLAAVPLFPTAALPCRCCRPGTNRKCQVSRRCPPGVLAGRTPLPLTQTSHHTATGPPPPSPPLLPPGPLPCSTSCSICLKYSCITLSMSSLVAAGMGEMLTELSGGG